MAPARGRVRLVLVAVSGFALLVAAAGWSVTEQHLARLRQMPPELRQALARNLSQFDQLPAAEQAALYALDRSIAEEAPEVRERYLEVARQYNLWFRAQPPAIRKRLIEAPPETRMDLVRELLSQAPAPLGERLDPILARTSSLHRNPILDQAFWIKSWFGLTPEQKRTVQAASGERRHTLLEQFGLQNGITDDRPLHLQRFQRDVRDRLSGRPLQGRFFEAMKPQAKEALTRRLMEARVLQDFQPEPVPPPRLAQFASSLPDWLLEPLDPLPPGAARLRLELLYRLAFPPPTEMPDGSGAAPSPPQPVHPERGEEQPVKASPGMPPTVSPF